MTAGRGRRYGTHAQSAAGAGTTMRISGLEACTGILGIVLVIALNTCAAPSALRPLTHRLPRPNGRGC